MTNNNRWWLMIVVLIAALIATQRVNALECYACDSNEDPECATKPGIQLPVEECPTENDECVQTVVSGITRRGCLSRLFPSRYCPEPCERCKKSLCNRDIFPQDRLKCYQCSGADCVNVANYTQYLMPCPVYNVNDRCFMKIMHKNNVQRGCEYSIADASTCPNSCIKCNRDGCNNEPGVWKQSCLLCSHTFASPDPACWRGQDPMADKCTASSTVYCENNNLYGETAKCYTYINEQTGVVQRGCSSNKPFFPTGTLTECYGENCNNKCLTISCNICSSKDDPKCVEGNYLYPTKCSEGTNSCYSCENGNHIRRGCADKEFFATRQPNEVCYYCSNSTQTGCNRFPVRTCYSCSSLDDEDCAEMMTPEIIDQLNCSSQEDVCVSTVVTKLQLTYVLRGCASHLAECTDNDPLCVRCNGSLCNDVPIDLSTYVRRKQISVEVDVKVKGEAVMQQLSVAVDFVVVHPGVCPHFALSVQSVHLVE
ncbi:uncharacterized protein LOC133327555 [Musca vetustissima]|uniref:uncharacterized protein LOC133327555 n=1 Tax=Musca vetustissima TaxID=27455 RepID=UPI002AB75F73|nr:uncharacterized protein LOC133327555 [Musca vetustissima]